MNTASPDTSKRDVRRRALLIFAIILFSVAVLLSARWFLYGRHHVSTEDASVAGDIVLVTPRVSGTVSRILVEDTVQVKAGDVLAELDETDLRLARARAEAEYLHTVREVRALYAQTESLAAETASARADLSVVEIDKEHAAADVTRRQAAATEGAVMSEELAHAEDARRSAEARVIAAGRRVDAVSQRYAAQAAMTAGVDVKRHPRILAAEAMLRAAIINEGRAKIRAPIDGQIARRAVTVGAVVAAGAPIMSIIPLHAVWVNANFKEAQLKDVHIGQSVELISDLYGSDIKFHGRVSGLDAGTGSAFALLPAQNATGNWIKVVQRVPVRVDLDAAEVAAHPLRVGLSMEADVDTQSTDKTSGQTPSPPPPAAGSDANLESDADADIAALFDRAMRETHVRAMHGHKGHTR